MSAIKLRFKIHTRDEYTIEELVRRIRKLPEGYYDFFGLVSHAKHTMKQRAYYRGVVLPIIAGESGMAKDDVHEALLIKFAPKEVMIQGQLQTIGRRSSSFNKKEFSEFLEEVIAMATNAGWIIPEPTPLNNESVVQLHNK